MGRVLVVTDVNKFSLAAVRRLLAGREDIRPAELRVIPVPPFSTADDLLAAIPKNNSQSLVVVALLYAGGQKLPEELCKQDSSFAQRLILCFPEPFSQGSSLKTACKNQGIETFCYPLPDPEGRHQWEWELQWFRYHTLRASFIPGFANEVARSLFAPMSSPVDPHDAQAEALQWLQDVLRKTSPSAPEGMDEDTVRENDNAVQWKKDVLQQAENALQENGNVPKQPEDLKRVRRFVSWGGPGLIDTTLGSREPKKTPVDRLCKDIYHCCLDGRDDPVLLVGEAGTGRKEAAFWLHDLGHRGSRSLASLQCGTVKGDGIGSCHSFPELFGEGVETPGQRACMDGGTVYLENLHELPLHVQLRLCMFLEPGRHAAPAAGAKGDTADVRVIASIHPEKIQDIHPDLLKLFSLRLQIPSLEDVRNRDPDILQKIILSGLEDNLGRLRPVGKTPAPLTPDAVTILAKQFSEAYSASAKLPQEQLWKNGTFAEVRRQLRQWFVLGRPDSTGQGFGRENRTHAQVQAVLEQQNHELDLTDVLDGAMNNASLLTWKAFRNLYCRVVLDRENGNEKKAARVLGIKDPTFRNYLKQKYDAALKEHLAETMKNSSLLPLKNIAGVYARYALERSGGSKIRAAAALELSRTTMDKYLSRDVSGSREGSGTNRR